MSGKVELQGKRVNRQIITDAYVFAPLKDGENRVKRYVEVKAMWDTGATNSQITREVATELGLKVAGHSPVVHGMGRSETTIYEAGLMIDGVLNVRRMFVAECHGHEDFNAIIGMDIIQFGRLTLEGEGDERTFTFEIP